MPKWKIVAAATVCVLAGGGCGSPGAVADDSAAPLSLTIWVDDKRAPAVREAADRFAAESGISVVTDVVAKDLQTSFVTAAQAGKGPDLVLGAHDWIGNLVQNGVIDPLQMTDAARARFDPLAIKGVTFDGQLYGVPFAVANVVLIRNTELAPEAPKTMEELVAKGTELKKAGRVSEIMDLPQGAVGDAYHLYPLFTSGGGYLFGRDADGNYDPRTSGWPSPGPSRRSRRSPSSVRRARARSSARSATRTRSGCSPAARRPSCSPVPGSSRRSTRPGSRTT